LPSPTKVVAPSKPASSSAVRQLLAARLAPTGAYERRPPLGRVPSWSCRYCPRP
jgi:hypothetical protein